MTACYILKSTLLNQFYIGFTQDDVFTRLQKHNEGFYTHSFTKKASDWTIFLIIECESTSQALKIEKHLKKMKSKKYLENLKKHPDIIKNLKSKYSI